MSGNSVNILEALELFRLKKQNPNEYEALWKFIEDDLIPRTINIMGEIVSKLGLDK